MSAASRRDRARRGTRSGAILSATSTGGPIPGSPDRRDAAARASDALRHRTHETMRWVGSIQLVDFLLFALMFVGTVPVLGDHASEIFLAAATVLALFRRPRFDLGPLALIVPAFVVMLGYIGMISLFAEADPLAVADWRLRLIRMIAVTVMIFVVATGRVDLRSAILGVAAMCLLNIPLFYAGLASDTYGGYLTGFFGDKNFAGLVYAITGILATSLVRTVPHKALVWLTFAGPLWLTGSRTSLAGFALAAVWMAVGSRLNLAGKTALGLVMVWVVQVTSEDYSRVGVFSDRLGSDLLRSRIDAASQIKVEEAGFFGRGLGNAFVRIQDHSWFFHNSYWSALVEGGWPWTVFLVAVTVLVLIRPFRGKAGPRLATAGGLGVVLLVTASRLGEVFYTVPWGLAIAFGLQAIMRARIPGEDPETLPSHGVQVIGGHSGRRAASISGTDPGRTGVRR